MWLEVHKRDISIKMPKPGCLDTQQILDQWENGQINEQLGCDSVCDLESSESDWDWLKC